MIHRITGTHAFTSGFGAALWLDMAADGGQSQRANIEQKVQQALKDLRLEEKMSLSHKAIYDQSVFILDAPVDLLYTACSILEWAAGLIQEFD